MKKIKIILLDDHKLFLEGMTLFLTNYEDIQIIAALANPIKALKLLETVKPDLLITDISMPEMNGIELIQIVQNKYPLIKILVISAYNNLLPNNKVEGYLTKTFDPEHLITIIREIMLNNSKHKRFEDSHQQLYLEFKSKIISKREKEIVKLVCNGMNIYKIAAKLHISKHTVESHKKKIYRKLKVNNVAGLTKRAIYLGFLE